jgi:hypothetical protein
VKTTDTAAIRELVQKLCQSSHPLAKSMDYLAEDLENMSKEYRFWQVRQRGVLERGGGEGRGGGPGGLPVRAQQGRVFGIGEAT